MPSKLKKVHTATFDGGIISTIAPELRPSNTAEYILNCDILSSGEGNIGVLTNQKGNVLIETPLPEGQNKTIGIATDEESNNFFFFVWNEFANHTIYQFNELERRVSIVFQNLTDTDGIDILRFDKKFKILHADVVLNNLLYWVDGLNNARKININKAKDKSDTGYGAVILEDYIKAYKDAPIYPAVPTYATDTTVRFNRLFGSLFKFCYRFVYDDGEKSNYSDYSIVPIPNEELYTGIKSIPSNNNIINIYIETGSRIVTRIEIAMLQTNAKDGGTLAWRTIANINKKEKGISDNSHYTYRFFNDSRYDVADAEKIIRPYSFMLKRPLCQSFVGNSMVYGNGYEGFDHVAIDIDSEVTYEDLFIAENVENKTSEARLEGLTLPVSSARYTSPANVTNAYGEVIKRTGRFNALSITVGNEVRKGVTYIYALNEDGNGTNFQWQYEAKISDTRDTIVNIIRNNLLGTGRIFKTVGGVGTGTYDIFQTVINGDQSATINFIYGAGGYGSLQTSVIQVQYNTLKENGVTVKNIKMGFPVKYGIMYENEQKSLVYTDDSLITNIATINEMNGIKQPVITLTINHKPPVWAKYYQIVRANYYDQFIQFLIQDVQETTGSSTNTTLDLLVGSLYTYQKLHPNTTLTYEFKKGDRIRFLSKINPDTHEETFYPFYETEVIEYTDTVRETVNSNVILNGTTTVTVASATPSNIGKFISVDGRQRKIVSNTGTTYELDSALGAAGVTAQTILSYEIIDYRSRIRIRKPESDVITIEDYSVVEVYTPTSVNEDGTSFFEFSKKFQINGFGTEAPYHAGDVQQQTASLPAIVQISDGDVYVRNRELPINDTYPGTTVEIGLIEDPSYSDFYYSSINDNGRINKEDTGDGEVHFGSRLRYSNNFIEGTRINGLNDFDNLDREDYNDQYGDFKLTKFDENRIFGFKDLKDTWIPVRNVLTQDNNGTSLLVGSAKLLNPIQYFAWDGGIGNNPESYARNGTQHYHVSANSGVVIRLGGSGVIPISQVFNLDNVVRENLAVASKNGADIYGGFNRKKDYYHFSIDDYQDKVYNNYFDQAKFILTKDAIPTIPTFEVVTAPLHGDVVVNVDGSFTYTSDTDYVGADSFTYRVMVDGVWSDPESVCLTVIKTPEPTSWRAKESSYFCVLNEDSDQTGYKGWTTLEEYYIYSNELTGTEKPNVITDANYLAPVFDDVTCVIPPPYTVDFDFLGLEANFEVSIDGNAYAPAVDGAYGYETSFEVRYSGIISPDGYYWKNVDGDEFFPVVAKSYMKVSATDTPVFFDNESVLSPFENQVANDTLTIIDIDPALSGSDSMGLTIGVGGGNTLDSTSILPYSWPTAATFLLTRNAVRVRILGVTGSLLTKSSCTIYMSNGTDTENITVNRVGADYDTAYLPRFIDMDDLTFEFQFNV